jgi:hypothetical protein
MSENHFLGRTDQLDAKELDSEFCSLLTNRLNTIFQYFGPEVTSFQPLDKIGPEMKIAVKFCLYYFTIFKSNASMGQQLLKIQMNQVWIV